MLSLQNFTYVESDATRVGMGLAAWWIWCAAIGRGRFPLRSSEEQFPAAMATPALSLPSSSAIVSSSSSSPSSSSSICVKFTSRHNISTPAGGFWELRKTPCGATRRRSSSSFSVDCAPESRVAERTPVEDDGPNLPCDTCDSKGWLLCDFCQGQKINVQVRANKFYRRCPSCRAVGVLICPQCKVFKCLTLPDGTDGNM